MKILAANAPEYFPGVRFFLKMLLVDTFVIADDIQYSTNSQLNRTKIKTSTGSNLLTVPVYSKGRGKQKINEVKIVHNSQWQRKHWRTIQSNYKYSPFFDHYMPLLQNIFKQNWQHLFKLNIATIDIIRNQMKIDTPISFSSSVQSQKRGTANIVKLAQFYQCDHYLIFDTELKYIDTDVLDKQGIKLVIKEFTFPKYLQQYEPFEEDLSTLDLLLNTGRQASEIILSGL